jgi:hypothetical protein
MQADAISDWLKSSIVGIVLLGALGSLLAVALLHALKLALKHRSKASRFFSIRLLALVNRMPSIVEAELRKSEDPREFLAAALFFLLALFGSVFILVGGGFIAFLGLPLLFLSQTLSGISFTLGSMFATLGLVFLYWSINALQRVLMVHLERIDKVIDQTFEDEIGEREQ